VNGVNNVIADGGKNITMPLGYEYHEIFNASRMKEKRVYQNIFGPLCHPSDIIFLLKNLPQLTTGDIIAIMDAGAYFVPNQMNFSNPRPAAILLKEGEVELIRKRESFDNIVQLDDI
jgi:diaminopimelate decarboxylase